MTLGERIAQKRKELGLSQEALGEKLGVSRQAIYKWESDATLPEVEKLMALSGLFGVSVGWLLGTEAEETAGGELTETQLKIVEEIVGRYLPAESKRSRRWLAVGAVALCLLVGNLYLRLGELTRQSQNLQYTVNQVETSVNRQVGGISDRVEEILKSQNDLTTDYGVELVSADLKAGTITFDLHALPRTYVPGMEALFLVNCGEAEPLEFPAQRGEDGVYRARATFPLTDVQELSVVFLSPEGPTVCGLERPDRGGLVLLLLCDPAPLLPGGPPAVQQARVPQGVQFGGQQDHLGNLPRPCTGRGNSRPDQAGENRIFQKRRTSLLGRRYRVDGGWQRISHLFKLGIFRHRGGPFCGGRFCQGQLRQGLFLRKSSCLSNR